MQICIYVMCMSYLQSNSVVSRSAKKTIKEQRTQQRRSIFKITLETNSDHLSGQDRTGQVCGMAWQTDTSQSVCSTLCAIFYST
mmetsp:Transcript_3451/g.5224  ORF Transcript_3451/g.5224 Transcript_3451/m.5224 type:complete len:84 (-) Transcript_3451:737-988(-)